MPQTRLYTDTDEATARNLMNFLDEVLDIWGLPVSAFENPEDPSQWCVSIYVDTANANDMHATITEYVKNAGYALEIQREDIPDKDWVAATLRDLSSVRAGRFIVHGSHERHVPKPHEIAIQIDAGLAFGTGHHGTTAGCLDMLSDIYKRRGFANILDLGTGSGVLAIAAAKRMPGRILASDIDPVATQTAEMNSRLNGVKGQIECITARGFVHPKFKQRAPFDLIVANILARPLQAMANELAQFTAPGGVVILSGLLPHQRAPLVSAFRLQGLVLERSHIREGWLVLVMHKPG